MLLLFLACFGFFWDSREKEWTTSTGSAFVMDTFVDQKLSGEKSGQAVEEVNQMLADFENRFRLIFLLLKLPGSIKMPAFPMSRLTKRPFSF